MDFVVNTPQGATPIQVTYGEPKLRHDEALEAFYQQFPHANEAIDVTPDTFDDLADREL